MSRKTKTRGLQLGALLAALIAGIFAGGAVKKSSDYFTETEILQNSDSTFIHMMGEVECFIDGTFGGASFDVETEIQLTKEIRAVSIPALIGVTSDTGWVSARFGAGGYRLGGTGGDGTTDVTFHCRRVSK